MLQTQRHLLLALFTKVEADTHMAAEIEVGAENLVVAAVTRSNQRRAGTGS